jgi:hypothetical protein
MLGSVFCEQGKIMVTKDCLLNQKMGVNVHKQLLKESSQRLGTRVFTRNMSQRLRGKLNQLLMVSVENNMPNAETLIPV